MHAPVSADELKALKHETDTPFAGDLKDPQLFKLLPLILVFVGLAVGAIITQGSIAATVLGLGGTAVAFLIILGLTRGGL